MKTLREWRTERVQSVRELAALAGVTHKTLIDIELGRRTPSYATIRALSDALGVSAGEIAEFAAALDQRGKDAA